MAQYATIVDLVARADKVVQSFGGRDAHLTASARSWAHQHALSHAAYVAHKAVKPPAFYESEPTPAPASPPVVEVTLPLRLATLAPGLIGGLAFISDDGYRITDVADSDDRISTTIVMSKQ